MSPVEVDIPAAYECRARDAVPRKGVSDKVTQGQNWLVSQSAARLAQAVNQTCNGSISLHLTIELYEAAKILNDMCFQLNGWETSKKRSRKYGSESVY